MKKTVFTLFAVFALVISAGSANAQWRLNAYGGYGFDDNVEATTESGKYFNGDLVGTAFWGGGVEYVLQRNYGIELLYMREDTELDVKYTSNVSNRDTNYVPGIGINFIMLSGNGYTPVSKTVELFGSAMIGLGIFDNKDPLPGATETSSTEFAYGFRAGANIWASNTVGIKLMGQLMSAAQAFGGGFYLGTGGVSAGVSPESSMLQFGIGGGLTFKLGSQPKKVKLTR